MLCSTNRAGGAAPKRGRQQRAIRIRDTLHSILAASGYDENTIGWLGGNDPGRGRSGRANSRPSRTLSSLPTVARMPRPIGRRTASGLIFMTTRPPYGCDQIFIMNADGSDQHLVSTGKGQTTVRVFPGRQTSTSSTRLRTLRETLVPRRRIAAKDTSGRCTRVTMSSWQLTRGRSKSG